MCEWLKQAVLKFQGTSGSTWNQYFKAEYLLRIGCIWVESGWIKQ